jgi:hypothetical protein
MESSTVVIDVPARWPHIKDFLCVTDAGDIDDELVWWLCAPRNRSPAEWAAGHEEWADFFEWRLQEFAGDRGLHRLLEKWTECMAYCCRRAAARACGVDPGEWVPQHERRPDLAAS